MSNKVQRLDPRVRKEQVIAAALRVAAKHGYLQMQRDDIADEAGVSGVRVSQLFGTMTKLRRVVMRHAVKNENHEVIAQGLVARDRHAMNASEEVKKAALDSILG